MVVLITGANKGLGFEAARQLGQLGHRVFVASRAPEKANAAAEKLRASDINADALQIDVCDLESIERARKQFEKLCPCLDVLINNAGVLLDQKIAASSPDMTAWRETLNTNVLGAVAVTGEFLPLIRRSSSGRIVNVSSILGSLEYFANPKQWADDWATGSAAYRVSKAALNMFTLSLAADLRTTQIKVNSAHPGWVKTDMGGESALLGIEDGAKTMVQLATLPDSGPTGGFFHLGKKLPW